MVATTSLESYWACDEASGNLTDTVGTNTLTNNNTVGVASGLISGARDFESGSSQYFSIADNASISVGDIDYAFAVWVNFESLAATQTIAAHWDGPGNQRAWRLDYDFPTSRFVYYVSSDGLSSGQVTVSASSFGAASTATWYYVIAQHDATANTISIQVNNGTVDSTSHSLGVLNSTAGFKIGAINPTPTQFFDGLMDEISFWKRTLSTQDRTDLYNSGAGLTYPFTVGGVTGAGALIAAPATMAAAGNTVITGTGALLAPVATISGRDVLSTGGSANRRGRFLLGRRLGLG